MRFLDFLSIFPLTRLFDAILVDGLPLAMLQTVKPLAFDLLPVWPGHHAMTLLLVIDEAAFVYSTIAIDKHSLPVHLIVFEVALVATTAWPSIHAVSFHLIGAEGALIARLVKHAKLAVTMPQSILVLPLEESIVPRLRALPMLLVVEPAALIDCSVHPH